MTQAFYDHFNTPIGKMQITASACAVTAIHFVDQINLVNPNQLTSLVKTQLLNYFTGKLTRFDIPIEPQGTDFQKQVWQALLTVKYGETYSYGEIAKQIKNTKAVRAVGGANARNPISIVIPCHRIILNNGDLSGYASGVQRKQWLLQHEANCSI